MTRFQNWFEQIGFNMKRFLVSIKSFLRFNQ
jgi:hypothetical protein